MENGVWQQIQQAATAMSYWEVAAVFLALAYVLLAAKGSLWCWPAALLSSSIYTYICWNANLKAEAGLQIFYVVMAIVGWLQWSKKNRTTEAETGHPISDQKETPIIQYSLVKNLIIIAVNLLATVVLGYILKNYLASANPYVDAFTTVFSLFTTWMVTQKVLENWLYWVVIDAVSVWLYMSRDLYFTALLFAFYTGLALYGYFAWKKLYKQQLAAVPA